MGQNQFGSCGFTAGAKFRRITPGLTIQLGPEAHDTCRLQHRGRWATERPGCGQRRNSWKPIQPRSATECNPLRKFAVNFIPFVSRRVPHEITSISSYKYPCPVAACEESMVLQEINLQSSMRQSSPLNLIYLISVYVYIYLSLWIYGFIYLI